MNSSHHYDLYIISCISQLVREFRLTLKHVERLKLKENLLSNKKKFLIEILHHREECLVWNFSEVEFINKEMISLQKIHIVSHEAWQVSEFSILKKLISVVRTMLQE
jgi:hypothetical protein